jgi:hypothetical protein
MMPRKYTFLHSLINLLGNLFHGRIHFPKKYFGKAITSEIGQTFIVFRHLTVDSPKDQEDSTAVFKVQFKFARFPLFINKRLSLFPTPFLIARTGFRQKIWMISNDGYFQGIYQWASKESAEAYPQSFIFRKMTKRAAPDTLSYEIIPDTRLSEYIDRLGCTAS